MSKGLEALEKLGNETVAIKDRNTIYMNGTSNNSYTHLTQVKNINKTCYETIEKNLKSLEIIKNKKVNIFHIWVYDDYEQYKEHYPFSEYHAKEDMLKFEEFDLLKEVLEE